MEEKQPFCNWASDEANRFYEILADAENNFVETLKKASNSELFDSIVAGFKEDLDNVQHKGKNSNWWSRSKGFLAKPCNMESKA